MKHAIQHATARRRASTACLLVAAVMLAGSAHGLEEGVTAQGRPYVSGGVADGEQSALHAQRERFTLWVVTAARKSGAYLADVQVKVTDSQQRVVFDAPLEGPWLLIDLPLGRYEVEARLGGEMQRLVTTIHPGDRHQAFFYFDVDVDKTSERGERPPSGFFDGSR